MNGLNSRERVDGFLCPVCKSRGSAYLTGSWLPVAILDCQACKQKIYISTVGHTAGRGCVQLYEVLDIDCPMTPLAIPADVVKKKDVQLWTTAKK